MFIRIGYRIAKVGNFFLGTLAAIIAMVAFAFGTYSLWDMYMTNQGAFTSSDILKYKPDATIFYSTEQRVEMLSALRVVDEVIVYDNLISSYLSSNIVHSLNYRLIKFLIT